MILLYEKKKRDDLKNYYYSFIGNKYYYYTNLADKPIITKLKVVEGKLCIERAYYDTKYPQYILDNNFRYYGWKHKIEGKICDDNIEYLNTKDKKRFLS